VQRILKAGVGLAAAVVLGSCTFSANSPYVAAVEVGAEIECELRDGDEVQPVEITVTEVDGSDASFNIHIPGPGGDE